MLVFKLICDIIFFVETNSLYDTATNKYIKSVLSDYNF